MALSLNLREIAGGLLRFGFSKAQVKGESASALSARNATDTGYANLRVATPVTGNDAVTLDYSSNNSLLDTDPTTPDTTYTVTYTASRVSQEKWVRTADSTKIKTIDYTYASSRVSTEVRKVYAADGTTIVAQLTLTYSYAGATLTSIAYVRNVLWRAP